MNRELVAPSASKQTGIQIERLNTTDLHAPVKLQQHKEYLKQSSSSRSRRPSMCSPILLAALA